MSDASHRFKTYVVLLIACCIFVAILVYLFRPFNIRIIDSIRSNVLEIFSSEVTVPMSSEVLVKEEVPQEEDNHTERRIRFTNLLLRYQRELAELESQADLTQEQKNKLEALRTRIKNIEGIITNLAE